MRLSVFQGTCRRSTELFDLELAFCINIKTYTKTLMNILIRRSRDVVVPPLVFECYFSTLTSSCIVWVWPALKCIVRNDDVSFTRSRRVNKRIILHYTSSRKTSFHAKFQAQCLHGLPVLA